MNYYESGKLLLSHNLDTQVVRVRNIIGAKKLIFTMEEFDKMPKTLLKKERFNELLNNHFRNSREDWEKDGVKFRSMENFDTDKLGNLTNYTFSKLPKYYIDTKDYYAEVTLVYHQGRVYYMEWGTPGSERCRLIDAINYTLLKWVRPRNCSPVMNLTKRCIV